MAVCLLVRHGHSSANAEGRLAGWTPGVTLTDRGRQQAQGLVERLRGIGPVRIVSSPLERCLATATPLAAALDLPVEPVDGLGECHYGTWTGRLLSEVATEPLWRTIQDQPEDAAFPSSAAYAGESLAAMANRVATAWAAIDAEVSEEHGPDAVWVATSHGDPIKAILAVAAGGGVGQLQRFHVDPGSISIIRRHGERTMVLGTNHRDGDAGALIRATSAPPSATSGDAVVGGGGG